MALRSPDFNLNGERIRWVTEQSIRTSVSRPGTRIRELQTTADGSRGGRGGREEG
jgi:hypothetical protein